MDKVCSGCQEAIDLYEDWYECKSCHAEEGVSVGFQLCQACRFGEVVRHAHQLSRVPGKARDYPYFLYQSPKKTAKGRRLVLGSYSAALPRSVTLREESIKAVISLLHFDTTQIPSSEGALNQLKRIFFPDGKYQSLVRHRGVVYFHVNIPDLADPAQLKEFGCEDFLPRSVLFIEYAMRMGNVLVHCEKGQRRSPTAFLAWMMYHGITLMRSMDLIASEYDGDEDWGESYKRHRPLWIDGPLDQWQSKFPQLCRRWIEEHKPLIRQWRRISTSPNHKQKASEQPSPLEESSLVEKASKRFTPACEPSEEDSLVHEEDSVSQNDENQSPRNIRKISRSPRKSPTRTLLRKRRRQSFATNDAEDKETDMETEAEKEKLPEFSSNKRLRSLEEDLLGL